MFRKSYVLTAPALGLFLLSAFADGTITEVRPIGQELQLSVRTFSGNTYQLQCSTNLVSGSWVDIGDEILAESGNTNLTVSAEAKSCWFRVVEEERSPDSLPLPPSGPPDVPLPLP
jgi:hypothetical protein